MNNESNPPILSSADLDHITAAFNASVDALVERLSSSPVFVDAVAQRVDARRSEPEMMTAEDVASALGVNPAFVYDHQEQLGVRRLGNGRKPRLRFERARVDTFLAEREPPERPRTRATRYGQK